MLYPRTNSRFPGWPKEVMRGGELCSPPLITYTWPCLKNYYSEERSDEKSGAGLLSVSRDPPLQTTRCTRGDMLRRTLEAMPPIHREFPLSGRCRFVRELLTEVAEKVRDW